MKHVMAAKSIADIGGHYSRPDIFQLHINRQPLPRITTRDAAVAWDAEQEPAEEHIAPATQVAAGD